MFTYFLIYTHIYERDRQTDKQTERQTQRQYMKISTNAKVTNRTDEVFLLTMNNFLTMEMRQKYKNLKLP